MLKENLVDTRIQESKELIYFKDLKKIIVKLKDFQTLILKKRS